MSKILKWIFIILTLTHFWLVIITTTKKRRKKRQLNEIFSIDLLHFHLKI